MDVFDVFLRAKHHSFSSPRTQGHIRHSTRKPPWCTWRENCFRFDDDITQLPWFGYCGGHTLVGHQLR
jgi:hypothetical protein